MSSINDLLKVLPSSGYALPGSGYAMNLREYALYALSLDTDPNDNFAIRGGKTLANTAIRCTSYSIPYVSYASWPYLMQASQYINMGLAAGKGLYSAYLYYQGYSENDGNKKNQAQKIALQALGHGLCAGVDNMATSLSSKSVVPMITTYVGIGAVTDLLGKSRWLHSKWFGTENKKVNNYSSTLNKENNYSLNDNFIGVNNSNNLNFSKESFENANEDNISNIQNCLDVSSEEYYEDLEEKNANEDNNVQNFSNNFSPSSNPHTGWSPRFLNSLRNKRSLSLNSSQASWPLSISSLLSSGSNSAVNKKNIIYKKKNHPSRERSKTKYNLRPKKGPENKNYNEIYLTKKLSLRNKLLVI